MRRFAPYISLLRPKQWLKNLMLLFPPLFGGVLFLPEVWPKLFLPLLSFCLASSANYAINDVLDAKKDAFHPTKKNRPIPSGAISARSAVLLGVGLFAAALVLGLLVSIPFLFILLGYLLLSSAYNFRLKDIPVVDIFCVSAGFLLRLHAGGIAFGVTISDWLFLTVFLLSIFLSLGKRIAEKQLLQDASGHHRPVLQEYPLSFLRGTIYMSGAAVLVTYAMYVVVHHPGLLYTIPLCCFGLFRFMYRVVKNSNGDPTEALTSDPILLAVSCLWLLLIAIGIYG
jgi:4-hydroxybenzoate polyprenyltransferase